MAQVMGADKPLEPVRYPSAWEGPAVPGQSPAPITPLVRLGVDGRLTRLLCRMARKGSALDRGLAAVDRHGGLPCAVVAKDLAARL